MMSSRNKHDEYNNRASTHPEGGGQNGLLGSVFRQGLGPEAPPRFSEDWRLCAPAGRVALTPGGCQIGYMGNAGCHQLDVF
jgi:hypothetical protein